MTIKNEVGRLIYERQMMLIAGNDYGAERLDKIISIKTKEDSSSGKCYIVRNERDILYREDHGYNRRLVIA